ncbi:site-specific DNA-methyltransferase [Marinobacterium iners]|uniref:DNA-methyltransferase n=1 Tax=Marinobacterium iners TaxID=48076 RepID=UPI001A8DE33B|nr:site-specific DNA-methyltransferase [Marinobacterium iners]QSR35651.1 site-specific DNA-methyltransferase [Marinobacterium iners]
MNNKTENFNEEENVKSTSTISIDSGYYLFNNDCLNILRDMKSNSVDLILTDPPYDIKNTKAGGNSKFNKSFQTVNDQLVSMNLVNGFNTEILDEMVRVCKNINIMLFCNKAQLPFYMDYFVTKHGCSFDLIKWVKTNAVPTFKNKMLSDTEYCFYARKKGYCNPQSYEDAKTLYQAPINIRDKKFYGHPTIKPIDLLEKLVRNCSREGEVILDPFMGSGSTGVAALNLNRKFVGIEIDSFFYDISKSRIKDSILKTNAPIAA